MRKTYKVLMIAPTSFFADYGCHVRIREEATVLRQLGNQVTICTYHNGRDVAGLDIRRTIPIPWRTRYEVGSSRHKIAFDALLEWTALCTALQIKPDIIHGHLHEGAFIGYPLSKLLGVPLVFDFQGSMTGEMIDHRFLNPQGPFYRPARWLEEKIVRLPSAIITSSRHAANLLTNDFHCKPDKIIAIPDCVNTDFFAPSQSEESVAALKASLGIPPERRVVVYLGLLAEWQGTGLLLHAAAQLVARRRDVHFLIMGFPSVELYRAQANQLGLENHVTFTGKIPYEQAPSFLSIGDVAVAPKISSTEGSGKLLNYMAMGLPVVSFDVPVSREYLDSLGVYARPGDATSLAEALEAVLADREQARALGQRLRQRAITQYTWLEAGQKIMDVYDWVSSRR
ncbi:MAG: glycosyltransferase family 4 protein [Chloroflexi bacterium]|nr:glycosyltransferase family 4 protein [Chloroflexota bacterium]